MKSPSKKQSMGSTTRKTGSFRRLNILPAAMAVCILTLCMVQPGPLCAQPSTGAADISALWNKMKAGVVEASGKATLKISVDYKKPQAEAAERLAKALSGATTADAIRPAAYEALARSGLAVRSTTEVFCQTGPRQLKRWLLPSQADNLALDFLEHQGWTLADLTRAVVEFPGGPGPALLKRPETIGLLLREWAHLAQQSPDDPEAFAPMLLARIAQIRGGGSDFTQGKIIPEQVEQSYFELMILTAGAFKGLPRKQGSARWSDAESVLASLASWIASLPARPACADDGPCSWFKDNLGKDIGDVAQDSAEEGFGALMNKALEKVEGWLGSVGDGALGKSLGQTVKVFKLANFLTSMISMYGGYSLTLTWEPGQPHYLGNEHGDATIKIIANVSTRPLADDATLACLKYIGIEKPSSDSAKDTTVEWVPLYGTPKHAQAKFPPSNRQNVGADGKAVLELTMSQEALGDQVKKSSKLKHDQVVMRANLIVYKSNPGKILAASVFGGVLGGNVEALKGWFANWFPKRAVARVPVEWHKLSRWRCVVPLPGGAVHIVYTSGSGTRSIWTWSIEGAPNWSGSGKFDLTTGSNNFTMTARVVTEGVTANATYPATVSLGGTDEEPTLILGMQGNAHIVAKGEGGGGAVSKNIKGQREFKLEEIE